MRKVFQNIMVLMAVMVASLGSITVAQAETTWRLAHKMPPESPEGKVYEYFAQRVKEHSGGDLIIQVYPSEQLGKEAAILEQLELNTVQLYCEEGFFLQKWVPEMTWLEPPFLFESRDQWAKFVKGDLVKSWLKQVEDTAGVRPLGELAVMERGPYRVLVSKSPIDSFEKVKEISLRMYPDKVAIDVWSSLGADLRMLAWTETYEGLKSGMVNALTAPIGQIENMRFYEVAPYITRTNEFWPSPMFVMNVEAFEELPEKDQKALLLAHQEVGPFSKRVMDESVASLKALENQGLTFVDMDLKPLFDHMTHWYAAQDKAGLLPEGFLDAVAVAKQ